MFRIRSRYQWLFLILGAIVIPWALMQADEPEPQASEPAGSELAVATFAGGCFWCMEPPFDKMDGVVSTTSGYTGGRTGDPSYEQVKTGRTGHIESMQVKYDPTRVSFEQLVSLFWHNVDPTQANGQFCDNGNQYRTAIFFHDDTQRMVAEETKKSVANELGKRIATEILKAETFYPAEDYHQDYYKKNPTKYKFYRWKCGRDARLAAVWGEKAGKP
ncbi:MAG: peptide-methionine (S)-S-oxide reductase MsrA [Rubripirellula sp.]